MIYADHAATAPLLPEVFEKMRPFLFENFANPSAMYSPARRAKRAIEEARAEAAALIGADADEIYFTSGGTESDTWALRGIMEANSSKKTLITSEFEHHAILNCAQTLEKSGVRVRYLAPDPEGILSPEALSHLTDSSTALVSLMYANNEIGTLSPISELAEIAHRAGALFHTDAVAAAGQIPIDVKREGIDLLSVSGHKFGAPKGIGFLFVKRGVPLPALFPGTQERSKRAGTENVAAIVGLGEACRIARERMDQNAGKVRELRDLLYEKLIAIPKTYLNGSLEHRLPGNLNISFEGIEGESLVLMMDAAGICLSTGSACTSGFTSPSHVLRAIGCKAPKSAIRITLGAENTREEVETLAQKLTDAVRTLRSLTPGWEML